MQGMWETKYDDNGEADGRRIRENLRVLISPLMQGALKDGTGKVI